MAKEYPLCICLVLSCTGLPLLAVLATSGKSKGGGLLIISPFSAITKALHCGMAP